MCQRDRYGVVSVVLLLVVALCAGCGSSSKAAQTTVRQTAAAAARDRLTARNAAMRSCFRRRGYAVTPDTPAALATAPARFAFVGVWNLLNPNRIALSITISRSVAGAERAAVWTRRENKRLGKGAVKAPVVRFGAVDVLWTAAPDHRDTAAIYRCVHVGSRA